MKEKIIILGGGVNGITAALTLQLMGFKTTCYAEHLVDEKCPDNPLFASLYPAASIIPHSVQTDELDILFPASLAIFKTLHQHLECLKIHHHFELFEFPKEAPDYTKFLHNYSTINQIPRSDIPHRPGAPDLYGWVFDCFVTEWPGYMQALYALYEEAGGIIHRQKMKKNEISDLSTDIVINCTGIWTTDLFEDTAGRRAIRGHLVHIPDKKAVFDFQNNYCSYNYTPLPSVYSAPDGSPSDVYFYPINGTWILGGSRQEGMLNRKGQWEGDVHEDTIAISKMDVPRPILELNEEILNASYRCGIGDSSALKARFGYRFTRNDTQNRLRLESTQEHGKKIIHNYGHGGAGVTLSWGCALKVLNIMENEQMLNFSSLEKHFNQPLLNSLQLQLQKVYWNHINK